MNSVSRIVLSVRNDIVPVNILIAKFSYVLCMSKPYLLRSRSYPFFAFPYPVQFKTSFTKWLLTDFSLFFFHTLIKYWGLTFWIIDSRDSMWVSWFNLPSHPLNSITMLLLSVRLVSTCKRICRFELHWIALKSKFPINASLLKYGKFFLFLIEHLSFIKKEFYEGFLSFLRNLDIRNQRIYVGKTNFRFVLVISKILEKEVTWFFSSYRIWLSFMIFTFLWIMSIWIEWLIEKRCHMICIPSWAHCSFYILLQKSLSAWMKRISFSNHKFLFGRCLSFKHSRWINFI